MVDGINFVLQMLNQNEIRKKDRKTLSGNFEVLSKTTSTVNTQDGTSFFKLLCKKIFLFVFENYI